MRNQFIAGFYSSLTAILFLATPITTLAASSQLYDFGGMFGNYQAGAGVGLWGTGGNALYTNPVTGGASCPVGYSTAQIAGSYGDEYATFYCYRPHTDTPAPAIDFQGMFGNYQAGGQVGLWGTGGSGLYANPATGDASCPAGYSTAQMKGSYGNNFAAFYCYRPHIDGRPPLYDFGGMFGNYQAGAGVGLWGTGGNAAYPNPATDDASCLARDTVVQVKGSYGNDYAVFFCYHPHEASPPPPPQPPACNSTTNPTTQPTSTSGSQTFTTPGNYSFAVPAYSGALTVELWGGGGGGARSQGYSNGEPSSWNAAVIAGGGSGGTEYGGAGGVSSGGDVTLTGDPGRNPVMFGFGGRGGDAAGPGGGAGGQSSYPAGGNSDGAAPGGGGGGICNVFGCNAGGGGGGYAKKTYAPGVLPASVGVQVGTGGPLPGSSGAPGMAKITWTATTQTLSLCAAGFELKNRKCMPTGCQVCPAGQTLDANNQCIPDTTCSPGFHFDTIVNQCVLDDPFTCSGGATLVNNICTCPAETHWDTAQNMCVADNQCPAGQHWNGTQCVADNCPSGQTWNGTQCVAANCPTGQHWNGTQCVADNCPASQVWNGSSCSCPAGTIWYQNRCQVGLCLPGVECGVDGNVYSKDLQCELSLLEECDWGCTNGACSPPPQPKVITWKVSPTLVKKNDTTGVFWNVINVTSCTVTGSNGDSWAGTQGSQVSGRIIARTVYTLHCIPYRGASWTDQTAVVNIIPVFQEQ